MSRLMVAFQRLVESWESEPQLRSTHLYWIDAFVDLMLFVVRDQGERNFTLSGDLRFTHQAISIITPW